MSQLSIEDPGYKKPILILVVEDDERRVTRFRQWADPNVRIVWARSVGKALGILDRDRGEIYQGIMLDHDLEKNAVVPIDLAFDGRKVVDAIIDCVSNFVPILVHSANKRFGPVMANTLREKNFHVTQIPMGSLTKSQFNEWIEYARELSTPD